MSETIYCRACNRYGMESQDEDSPVCPTCGANAQWEDEVTLPVKDPSTRGYTKNDEGKG